jgi:hypothetical protein
LHLLQISPSMKTSSWPVVIRWMLELRLLFAGDNCS